MAASGWDTAVARPRGALGGVVARHQGYLLRGGPPGRHLGLPSPHLTLIFALDAPVRVARHPDPTQAPGSYRALLGGLHTAPAVVEYDGAHSGIQLAVDPIGARALLGVPAGALAGVDLTAADLLGPLADELPERLRLAPTWDERFRLLDDLLGRRVDVDRLPPAEVRHAWRMLRGSGGRTGVAAVARAVGWSERHLAQRFRVEIGLTPKAAARVIRFDRARRLLPRATGADTAARCGYADQPHLVRDFTAFAGLSPRAWLAAEVGNLQSTGPGADRDWAS